MARFDRNSWHYPSEISNFTSGLLFYELSIELNLDFDMFVTTPIVFNMIDELIEEAERQTKVEISVLVKEDMVIPRFYDETFHTGRIKKFKDIKRWFTENSTPIIPDEKIDMIRPLYEEGKVNSGLEYTIDLTFLANRENSFLITDDLGFDKFLKLGNRTVSTERYLLYRYPEKRIELIAYLLSRKYIGLGVTSDELYFAYIDQHLPDKGHVYEYALLNITLNQNYLPSTIPTVIDFLKKMALNALITKEKYRIDATNVFVLLIKGLPNRQLVVAVENIVQDVFFLLGEYQDISLAALEDAKRITRK